jgi:hypothetical protein
MFTTSGARIRIFVQAMHLPRWMPDFAAEGRADFNECFGLFCRFTIFGLPSFLLGSITWSSCLADSA